MNAKLTSTEIEKLLDTSGPIIKSLDDDDLYKVTMGQVMWHNNAHTIGKWRFVCRNKPAVPMARLIPAIQRELETLTAASWSPEAIQFLAAKPYIRAGFLDFLQEHKMSLKGVIVMAEGENLVIEVTGPMPLKTWYEIKILAIVSEVFHRATHWTCDVLQEGHARLLSKIEQIRNESFSLVMKKHPFEVFEFGTRRRFSGAWHEHVLTTLLREVPGYVTGTSNIRLAAKLSCTAIGTMAHEHLQKHQGLGGALRLSQVAALEEWVQFYRGHLGYALTDVITMDAFLTDFDLFYAKLYDGLRNDSGDPIAWGEKAIAHYERLKIDPNSKRLIFSNSIDIPKAMALHERFGDRIATGFGIGTNLTNDLGVPSLNIVVKLVEVDGHPVAKISDDAGKTICTDEAFVAALRHAYKLAA